MRPHQRITALILLIIVPTLLYVIVKQKQLGHNLHFLDGLTHTPIAIQPPNDGNDGNNDETKVEGNNMPPLHKPQDETSTIVDVCTVVNPLNRAFIDLKGLSAMGNDGKPLPWGARGYDSGVNYTLGICSSPMKKLHDKSELKDEVDSSKIGGYYKDPKTGLYVSIGEFNTVPVFRGKKLTLTYENGSYCNLVDDNGERVRKSTIITLVCDREMLSKASVSYIGNSHDCDYMFEIRSHHVCPTAAKGNNLNAVWIFILIVLATIVGYFSGTILYKNIKQLKKLNT